MVQLKFRALVQLLEIRVVVSISFPNVKPPNLRQIFCLKQQLYCHLLSKSTTYVIFVSSLNKHLDRCLNVYFLSKHKVQECLCCSFPHFLDLNHYIQIFATCFPPLSSLLSSKLSSVCQEPKLLLAKIDVKNFTSTCKCCKKKKSMYALNTITNSMCNGYLRHTKHKIWDELV